ncbi:MAG: hypothetical protein JSS56_00330 [Proteobacteria bacterium]|nr:hypothetical protein [Pseudomonadota bacterium]
MRLGFNCNTSIPVSAYALLVGALIWASDVAAAGEQPFKAAIEAQAVGFPAGVYESSGIASGLGKITEAGNYHFVQYVQPGVAYLEGTGTQTAANGDTLSFTFNEIVNFNVTPFKAAGLFTITGGTGRFATATGGGTFATSGVFRSSVELGLSIEYSGMIKY